MEVAARREFLPNFTPFQTSSAILTKQNSKPNQMSLTPLSMVLLVFPRQDEVQMLWIVSFSNTQKYIHIDT